MQRHSQVRGMREMHWETNGERERITAERQKDSERTETDGEQERKMDGENRQMEIKRESQRQKNRRRKRERESEEKRSRGRERGFCHFLCNEKSNGIFTLFSPDCDWRWGPHRNSHQSSFSLWPWSKTNRAAYLGNSFSQHKHTLMKPKLCSPRKHQYIRN